MKPKTPRSYVFWVITDNGALIPPFIFQSLSLNLDVYIKFLEKLLLTSSEKKAAERH